MVYSKYFDNYKRFNKLQFAILLMMIFSSDWGQSQTNDRAYLTITTVPSLANCKDCAKVAASYEEEGNNIYLLIYL